ncbi:uncharacterized protein LOC6546814 isoform X2 [Drosophila erecta]|uniref:uncharacterized protein LOC6546814 isoform X2 n=1 Tax=Drosophila erecta TaxID=7220 RepID=UPI000F04A28D|nr:uncharacterized protein LOC6546814 isoform X2 [Drosophila erecta]
MSKYKKIHVLVLLYLTVQIAKAYELKEANIKVYCSEYVPYGKRTNIVIAMESLPVKYKVTIWLSTPSYLLALFELGGVAKEMGPSFRSTSSISEELSYYGIKSKIEPDYEQGFFANLSATFWSVSDTVLTLLGRIKLKQISEIKISIPVEVSLPPRCSPQLTVPKCSDPQSPRRVLITRGILINAIFLESCNLPIKAIYHWSLRDFVGLTQFASYTTDGPFINIPAFTMRFPTSYEPWRNLYLLQVEGKVNGLHFAARCYLKSIMGNVEAVILGGQNRLARQSETIWMNGSLSCDFSKRRGDIQFSSYNWNCFSVDDIRNPFCQRNISCGVFYSSQLF